MKLAYTIHNQLFAAMKRAYTIHNQLIKTVEHACVYKVYVRIIWKEVN